MPIRLQLGQNGYVWCGEYQGKFIDDVRFVREIYSDIQTRHIIDRSRVYAMGQSSGGMMSDVLAYVEEDTLLITGLTNHQVIRTAEMLDLKAILFVRGKMPCQEVIELAEEKKILLMMTKESLFTVAGILYGEGLRGISI